MSVRKIPADGSKRMDDKLMEAIEPYDYNELADFAMGYISGHYAESYEIGVKESRERIIPRIKQGASEIMRAQAGGYTAVNVRRLDVTTHSLTHTYAMLPVWTLMHEFGGKTYYFVMNGQTGKMAGKLPVSIPRAAAIFGGVWLAAFLILLLGVLL
jgi:hypothetical protein